MIESIKNKAVKIYHEFINFTKQKLKIPESRIRIIFIIDLLYKSMLFTTIIGSDNVNVPNLLRTPYQFVIPYLAFIIIVYSFGYLFTNNKQIVYHFIINFVFSIMLILDLSYFRANRDMLSLKHIFFCGTFNPVNAKLINFKLIDILLIIDSIVIFIYYFKEKIHINEAKSKKRFKTTIIIGVLMVISSHICIDVFPIYGCDKAVFKSHWETFMEERSIGPMGYHFVDTIKSLTKAKRNASNDELKEVDKWLKNNDEKLEPNQYYRSIEGKNVIFLQIESFENFVINKKVNGREISPFINKIIKYSLYFDNFYEQNSAGNSIDCDFLVNTSIFPLEDKITALYYGENVYSNSLSRLVKKKGYKTICTHAENIGSFNWTELHKNGFGTQQLWDISQYTYDETVGYGLSDRSFYSQVIEKIKDIDEPYFLQLASLSSHGPFKIQQKYRSLNLPTEINNSYLGGYFESIKYADKQIEMFFTKMKENNLLKDTAIVIYGDHGGVHKYYNEDIQGLNYENNWWKKYDKKIPLIIYSEGLEPKKISACGGQVDILPTIAYMMGIEKDQYKNTSMGRVLVNTNRQCTVIKGNILIGDVKNEEEKKHLLDAYKIGEIIIKKDLFSK